MAFTALDKLINLHDGYRRCFKIDHHHLLMIQEEGSVFIVDSRCPHQQASLEQGDVVDAILYCPLHGFGFSLHSGQPDTELCGSLRTYPIVYEGVDIGTVLPDIP